MTNLGLIMKYSFKDWQLPDNFCEDRIHEIKRKLKPTGFFTIMGIPSVGVSLFIRFLATRNFACFVYLDTFSLAQLTKHEFYVSLLKSLGGEKIPTDDQEILELCKVRIQKILEKENHIVFLFNRFDQLGKEIDQTFLGNIRTLRHIAADKISMIFVSHKPLYDVAPKAISGGNLDVYSNFYYFKPFSESELTALLRLHSPELITDKTRLKNALQLSGGHFQLCQLMLKSERPNSLSEDRFLKLCLKDIYDSFSYSRKKELKKIAFGKKIADPDPYLIHIGLVSKSGTELFSPLLTEYIQKNTALALPVKEKKLFQILKNNLGTVVSKEEIFRLLWKENQEEFGSDWALNSLIYRLRKNPAFRDSGYVIESVKKQGYLLEKV